MQAFPFRLEFRDRYNRPQVIKITQAERDSLAREKAIRQKVVSRKQYEVVNEGVEFFRAENDLLLSVEFTREPAHAAVREYSPIDQIRQWGLFAEAAWLSARLNCTTLLHRAPVKSSTVFTPRIVPVLFSRSA